MFKVQAEEIRVRDASLGFKVSGSVFRNHWNLNIGHPLLCSPYSAPGRLSRTQP